jgi:hypothetical protein
MTDARHRPSDRLELEVALLAAARAATPEAPARRSEARTVLLAVTDPELRTYVAECLHERADLRVLEIGSGDGVLDVARRTQVDLLIGDVSLVALDEVRPRMPVVLIGDELPDQLPVGAGNRIAVVLQPFNARRLLDAVDGLLEL